MRTLYLSSHLDLYLLFRHLLFLTIYSLFACPFDDPLESPICHGLSVYHTLVLDPYVPPPQQHQPHSNHPAVRPTENRTGETGVR